MVNVCAFESAYWDLYFSSFYGEGSGNPLQYSCLKNPMDGGACWAAVHRVTKGRTRLSNFTFTFHFHALEKEMATHSSVLAWRIPAMGEPSGLPCLGSHRVGYDWSDLAAAAAWVKLYAQKWKCKWSGIRLFATPWTVAYQASPSMGFFRQECWNGLSFPSPRDLPDPGIKPASPALQADALPSEPRESAINR